MVQNKMHWAVHGKTAAEMVVARLDANCPQPRHDEMPGTAPRKAECGDRQE
jgi:hypothetical protein